MLQVLGIRTLNQLQRKIKSARGSLGFLHRSDSVFKTCASPLMKMHLGLFCIIMMAPNFALNSLLLRYCKLLLRLKPLFFYYCFVLI
ncbi:hypothetical protein KSP39_PZI022034 [Platanthera zijinensis]|uniref:Uncharacterized protein n=1 Tax=Platanthera zijinensis TaxID=2320716 RepID=A0AAP0AYB0_9ASPA